MPSDPLDDIPPEKLERLRTELAGMLREKVDLSVRRLRERAQGQTQHAQLVLAAYRAGRFPLEVPRPATIPATIPPAAAGAGPETWDSPTRRTPGRPAADAGSPAAAPRPIAAPTAAQLSDLVAGVDTYQKALDVTREVMRARAEGTIDDKLGEFLLAGIREARQSIKGAASEGDEEVEDLRPCTAEGAELVAVFEGIADDARRERVLAFVRAELAADEAAGPRALGQAEEAPAEPAGGG